MLFRALVWAGLGVATGGEPAGWAGEALDGVMILRVEPSDPNVRMLQLIGESEELRQTNEK